MGSPLNIYIYLVFLVFDIKAATKIDNPLKSQLTNFI